MEYTPTPDFTWVDKITSKQPFFPVAFQPEDPEALSIVVIILLKS